MAMSDDEITAALMLGTEMNPDRFELVPDGPWIKAARERTSQKDLFVYFHRKSKMFGLACWSVKPRTWGQGIAVCVEICIFSGKPEEGPADLPDMEWTESRCRPGHVVAMSSMISLRSRSRSCFSLIRSSRARLSSSTTT